MLYKFAPFREEVVQYSASVGFGSGREWTWVFTDGADDSDTSLNMLIG